MSKSILDRREEAALMQAWRAGDLHARDRLIMSLYPFITYRVKRYHRAGLDPSDLMQEGYRGGLRALRTFNPALGFRFTTYAVNWIWAYISHYARRHGHHQRHHLSLNDVTRRVDSWADVGRRGYERGSDLTVQDALGAPDPSFAAYDPAALVHLIVRTWQKYLSPREQTILARRYLDGDSLEAIGRDLHLSRERIRQLEARALDRLRPHLAPLAEELRA